MSDRPESFSFDVNQYERANQPWACGRECEGTPCTRGPGPEGECGAVCVPQRIGDRYYCQNAAQLSGMCDDGPGDDGSCAHWPAKCTPVKKRGGFECGLGICADGPRPDGSCCQPMVPCRPRRRVLARRQTVTLCVLAVAIGAALLLAGGPDRQQMVSPGELALHHGALSESCSQCHAAGSGTLGDWLHTAVAGGDGPSMDDRCLECHGQLRQHKDQPHTADSALLAAWTAEARSRPADGGSAMLRLARASIVHGRAITCAVCHREHQGADHQLAAMADNACQSCHAVSFDSFSDGHPEFADYPYTRRSRIYFDHQSHYGAHFRDAGRLPAGEAAAGFLMAGKPTRTTCVKCHVADGAGEKMLVRGFDQTCGACHAEQITDELSPGLAVLAFPLFPVAEQPAAEGENAESKAAWPPKHPLAGGSLSPILRLLLSTNAEFLNLERQLGGLDLSDLSAATDQQRAAAAKLPGVIKAELAPLAAGGRLAVEQRLAEAWNLPPSSPEVVQMAKLLPTGHIELALQNWLGGANVARVRPDARGTYPDDRDRTLRYRPDRHADPVLRAWIDASVRRGPWADASSPMHQLYRSLSRVSAVGRCLKCHTIESGEQGEAHVNWHTYRQPPATSLTTYTHRPHMVMLRDEACLQCHVLGAAEEHRGPETIFRPEFVAADGCPRLGSHEFRPNFQPMNKAICATCHTTGRVTQGCTTCHNYHVQRAGRD